MKLSLKKSIIFLFLILLLGGFLRLYKLGQQSFIADEYLGVNVSYGYLKTGHWVMWDFNQNQPTNIENPRADMYYWQVAKVFKYMGASEQSGRLVSVLWGLAGILLVFFVSYALFKNPTLSLISAAFLAVSNSALVFDRKLRMYSMFAPVYFLLSYLVYKFLESKPSAKLVPAFFQKIWQKTGLNWLYVIPAALVGIVSLNTHLLTANIGIVIFVYLIAMAVITYRREKSLKNKYIVMAVLSMAVFLVISKIAIFKEALHYFTYNVWAWSYLEKVTADYSYGLLGATFLVAGAFYLLKNGGKAGLWVVLSFLVPLVLAIYVWDRNAGAQFIYFTEPFKVILIAAGVYFVANLISEKVFSRKPALAFWSLAFYLLLILINIPFFFSSDSFYANPAVWSYPNYREVFGYYLKHRQAKDVLVSRKLPLFYIRGSQSDVLIYGTDNELTMDEIKLAQEKYDRLWFIGVANSFIEKDARDYIAANTRAIETKYSKNGPDIRIWEKYPTQSQ